MRAAIVIACLVCMMLSLSVMTDGGTALPLVTKLFTLILYYVCLVAIMVIFSKPRKRPLGAQEEGE